MPDAAILPSSTTGYLHDADGNATWYVSDAPVADARTFSGTWVQFANGQTLTGAYRAPTPVNGNVAPVTIQFQGADAAISPCPPERCLSRDSASSEASAAPENRPEE